MLTWSNWSSSWSIQFRWTNCFVYFDDLNLECLALIQISWQFYCNHRIISLIVLQYRKNQRSFRKICFDALQCLQIAQFLIYLIKHTNELVYSTYDVSFIWTYQQISCFWHTIMSTDISFWTCQLEHIVFSLCDHVNQTFRARSMLI